MLTKKSVPVWAALLALAAVGGYAVTKQPKSEVKAELVKQEETKREEPNRDAQAREAVTQIMAAMRAKDVDGVMKLVDTPWVGGNFEGAGEDRMVRGWAVLARGISKLVKAEPRGDEREWQDRARILWAGPC